MGTLTCEEGLEMLVRCVSMIPADPNPLSSPVLKAFRRTVGKHVAEGRLNSEQCLNLLGRCGAHLEAGPPLEVASDILFEALRKLVTQLSPERCLFLLLANAAHTLQDRTSDILLAAFEKTLSWGTNVLVSLARSYEASLDSAAEMCLAKCGSAGASG